MLRSFLQPVSAIACAMALAGCQFQDPVESLSGPTMGSTYSIKYVHSAQAPEPEALQQEVDRILSGLDQALSTYRDDSAIQRFNALPADSCLAMPQSVLDLVQRGHQLSQLSQGALDLTIGPLLAVWGFGPHAGPAPSVLPDAQAIASAQAQMGYDFLYQQGGQLCKRQKPLQVDFNSIAAGYAVDRISAHLEQQGVDSYLVEITGELKARGHKPDGQPWRIAIEAPLEGTRTVQTIIELDGWSVSTSGDYRNFFMRDGKRYSHTLNPRTGTPITHHLASVTVMAPSALQADGLSTLLMVLGPEAGKALAERENIAALFIIREGEGFVTQPSRLFVELTGKGETQ